MPEAKIPPIIKKRAIFQDAHIFDFSDVGIGRPSMAGRRERLETAKSFRDTLLKIRVPKQAANRVAAHLVLGLTQKQVGRLLKSPKGKGVSAGRVGQDVAGAMREAEKDSRHFF